MSTGSVTANLPPNSYTNYLQQRQSDLKQLGQDLQKGDLKDAQTEFNTIQTLGQNGPFAGDAFSLSNRQQDFTALGQELSSGSLSGAQQAFTQLRDTFRRPQSTSGGPAEGPSATSGTTGASEIVLNLANAPAGEQITIGLSSGAGGGEQVSINATNPQSSSPEQISLSLNPNSNQEVVLNLFNSTGGSQSQSGSGSGVSVSA